jgi:osmotically inducible lipoprotein OsmB
LQALLPLASWTAPRDGFTNGSRNRPPHALFCVESVNKEQQMMRRTHWVSLILALALAGCGVSKADRVTGGAAIGAVTGGTIGALGGPFGFGAGALVGAVAGGGAGLVSSPQEVNLGTPPWHGVTRHMDYDHQ